MGRVWKHLFQLKKQERDPKEDPRKTSGKIPRKTFRNFQGTKNFEMQGLSLSSVPDFLKGSRYYRAEQNWRKGKAWQALKFMLSEKS